MPRRGPWSCLLLSLSLSLPACGARTGLALSPTDGGSDAPPVCPAPLPAAPTELQVFGARCELDARSPGRVALASIVEDRLVGVHEDGSVRELYRFGLNPPSPTGRVASRALVARGEHLFAAVTLAPPSLRPGDPLSVETVTYRLDGALTTRRQVTLTATSTSSHQLTIAASASGYFAWSVKVGARAHLELQRVDGETYPAREGWQLAINPAAPLSDGTLLVLGEDPSRGTGDLYWLDPCTGRARPTALRGATASSFFVVDERLLWVDRDASTYHRERGSELTRTPLGESTPWSVFDARRDTPVALLGRAGSSEVAVFDGERETLRTTLTPPPGLRVFHAEARFEPVTISSAHAGFGVDSLGRVTLGLRTDALGGLYTTTDGARWNAVGLPVGRVYRLSYTERGGTWVITTEGLGLTRDDWTPAPAGSRRVDGASTQVVVPDRDLATVLPSSLGGHTISRDAGCVAWWSDRGRVTVLQLRSNARRTFDLGMGRTVNQYGGPLTWRTD